MKQRTKTIKVPKSEAELDLELITNVSKVVTYFKSLDKVRRGSITLLIKELLKEDSDT
jgi:hypothetical protein